MNIDEFKEALGADVVIPIERPGALGVLEALALRNWYDRRRPKCINRTCDEPRVGTLFCSQHATYFGVPEHMFSQEEWGDAS